MNNWERIKNLPIEQFANVLRNDIRNELQCLHIDGLDRFVCDETSEPCHYPCIQGIVKYLKKGVK